MAKLQFLRNPYTIFGLIFVGFEVAVTLINALAPRTVYLSKFISPLRYWNTGLEFPASINGWVETAWPAFIVALLGATVVLALQKQHQKYYPAWFAASSVAVMSVFDGAFPDYRDRLDPLLDSFLPLLLKAIAPACIIFGIAHLLIWMQSKKVATQPSRK